MDDSRFDRDARFGEGRGALDDGRLAEAAAIFERLVAEAEDPAAWFNLGLAYKLQRQWADAVRCNRRSLELEPTPEAAWNLGIAATAVRDWTSARVAWSGLGVVLDAGDPGHGPPRAACGMAAVSLPGPDGGTETVWGDRIDPCRMRLLSVPLPASGHRWGDVVLHDAVPIGRRHHDGQDAPVFEEIERMEASAHATHALTVTAPAAEDARALTALFDRAGLGAEDWTESIAFVCRSCSLSRPHVHDAEGRAEAAWLPDRRFGLAGDRARIDALLATWTRDGHGRASGDVEEVG